MAIRLGDGVLRILGDTTDVEQKVGGLKGRLNGLFGTAGRMALGGLAAGIAATAGAAVKGTVGFASFDDSIRNTAGMLGLAEDEIAQVEGKVLNLSKKFPNAAGGADALAAALYQAVSAGVLTKDQLLDTAGGLEFLESAARGAVGGAVDTSVSVGTLATALNAFKIPAKDSMRVSDLLFKTVANGVTTYDQLGASLFQAAPIFASAGLSLEELLASTATMTKQGTPTAVAMTQMRAAVQALLKPTPALAEAFKEAGFESGQAALDALGYHGALNLVRDAANGDIGVMTEMLGTIEATQAVLGVTGQNAAQAAADLDAMGKAGGATMTAFESKSSGLAQKWGRFVSVLKANSIEFAQNFTPAIADAIDWLTGLLDGSSEAGAMLNTVKGIVADLAAGGFDLLRQAITGGVQAVEWFSQNVLPGLIAAVQGVSGFIATHWPSIRSVIVSVINAVGPAINWFATTILPTLMQWAESVVGWFVANWPLIDNALSVGLEVAKFVVGGIIEAFNLALSAVQNIWPSIQVIIETVVGVIANVVELFLNVFTGNWEGAWNNVKGIFETLWNGIVNFIGTIPQLILGILQGLLAGAMVWAGGFLGRMVTWAGRFVGQIVGRIGQLGGRFMGAIASLPGRFIGWFGNLISRGASQAGTFVTRIINFVKTLPGKFIGGLSSLPGRLVGFLRALPGRIMGTLGRVGKGIIDGVIGGIRSAGSAVADAVLSPIRDAIGGVMSFLGIKSPSRLFEEIGENSMAGLAQGLDRYSRLPAASLDRTFADLAGRRPMLAGAGGGGGNLHIEHVHLPNVTDAPSFVEELRHIEAANLNDE